MLRAASFLVALVAVAGATTSARADDPIDEPGVTVLPTIHIDADPVALARFRREARRYHFDARTGLMIPDFDAARTASRATSTTDGPARDASMDGGELRFDPESGMYVPVESSHSDATPEYALAVDPATGLLVPAFHRTARSRTRAASMHAASARCVRGMALDRTTGLMVPCDLHPTHRAPAAPF